MVDASLISAPAPCVSATKLRREDDQSVDWIVSDAPVGYEAALGAMRARVEAIVSGRAREAIWLLEHAPLYTAGTSADPKDLLVPRFPVFEAGRGGQYTYHGPGQRVAYVMLDLRARGRDVRCLVQGLENWVIDTLASFNVRAGRREGRVGVWVGRPDKGFGREDKIAAIGVRVSRWVSFHGISVNVSPDLSHYDGIVPCGITDQGVTSLEDLGQIVVMPEFDATLRRAFGRHFGATARAVEETMTGGD